MCNGKKSIYYRLVLGFALIFILSSGAFAEDEYRIKATADRKNAVVGDKIMLTVTVSSNSSISVQPAAPELKDFDVMGTSSSNRISIVNGAQYVEMSNIYVLRPLKSGKLVIGEFALNYNDAQNISRSVKTVPITIEVAEAEEKKDDPAPTIEPQKTAKELPAEDKNGIISNFMKVASLVVIFIFASIWFIMWQSSRRDQASEKKQNLAMSGSADKLHINVKQVHEEAGEAPETADGRLSPAGKTSAGYDAGGAMARIESLSKKGEFRDMYLEIPRLIKYEVGRIVRSNLMERTTAELCEKAREAGTLSHKMDDLVSLLDLCDLVNYARYSPGEEEIKRTMSSLNEINRVFKGPGARS